MSAKCGRLDVFRWVFYTVESVKTYKICINQYATEKPQSIKFDISYEIETVVSSKQSIIIICTMGTKFVYNFEPYLHTFKVKIG